MNRNALRLFLVWVAVLLLSLPAFAEENLGGKYFMVVFGYQGATNRAVDSHTFATFYQGDSLENGQRGGFPTISWLPTTGVVRPVRRELGRNFSLEETLRIARANAYEVHAFGPYEISYDLYERALVRITQLNSGNIDYRMIGLFGEGAINCIRAVGEIAGPINVGRDWGFAGSRDVVEHFAGFIYGFPQTQPQIRQVLNVDSMVRF